MSSRVSSCGVKRPVRRADNLANFIYWLSENCGSVYLLERLGTTQAYTGMALLLLPMYSSQPDKLESCRTSNSYRTRLLFYLLTGKMVEFRLSSLARVSVYFVNFLMLGTLYIAFRCAWERREILHVVDWVLKEIRSFGPMQLFLCSGLPLSVEEMKGKLACESFQGFIFGVCQVTVFSSLTGFVCRWIPTFRPGVA
jgi:hypothetical protein